MMKRIIMLLLACCLLIAPATAAGGSGTAADPYIIQTVAELQSVQNNLAAYYKLGNNINLQGVSFTPIGSQSTPFIGSFDGAGYTISNLVISSSTKSTGFFSCLGPGATIKDVIFQDCTISSTSFEVGTVFGSIIMSTANHDLATIDNVDCVRCAVQASDYGVGVIGGIIETAAVVDVIDCDVSYASLESTSGYHVGVMGCIIRGSHVEIIGGLVSDSRIKASTDNGGAIGYVGSNAYLSMTDTEIVDCIFEGSGIGIGAIGRTDGSCTVSLNGVDVLNCVMMAPDAVGGIVGFINTGDVSATDCSVTDCTIYATSKNAGGISGHIMPAATVVFSSCTVTDCTILTNTYAAGICSIYS